MLSLIVALAGCASTWDRAVADANAEDKPLVIEFYASWCGPCKWFEREVLSTDEVQAELEHVAFYRFDFDSTAGKHHAARLGVTSVPTFVAVDREGFPAGGLQGAVERDRFVGFLRWTQRRAADEAAEAAAPPAP